MKAVVFTEFGGPEVLRLADVPAPHAGPGRVRVRVRAAGVLPFDTGLRSGRFPPAMTPGLPDEPVVPGNEFAGDVDEVGEGVAGFAIGDPVLGFTTTGAYAEYVVVPADQLAARPPAMPWDAAAALPANGQGAHTALRHIRVRAGDVVLIHAAAGGFGSIAVQLAQAWGAKTVIGTAAEANHDYLRGLGAVPVAYGPGLVDRVRALAPRGVDAAIDAAGPEALRACVELVGDRARIVTMTSPGLGRELGLPERSGTRSGALLAESAKLWEKRAFTVHVRAAYPLDRAADAHRDVGTGHGRGKVVLTVAATP